jgi:hypothetical protein
LWDIPSERLSGWLERRFNGEQERYLAACLLDTLIYRSSKQFDSSLCSLFRGNVRHAIDDSLPGRNDLDLALALNRRKEPGVRLVPVICECDPPSKSGPYVMRRLKRLLKIRDEWMVWPWQALDLAQKGQISSIVFVDDFLGTGTQFGGFLSKWQLDKVPADVRLVYAPVVAHEQGVGHLSSQYPNVTVVRAELLSHSHNFFSATTWRQLTGRPDIAEDAAAYYREFVERNELMPRTMSAFGVGDLSLSFGFSHGTPNNSLPILWYDGSDRCNLLER